MTHTYKFNLTLKFSGRKIIHSKFINMGKNNIIPSKMTLTVKFSGRKITHSKFINIVGKRNDKHLKGGGVGRVRCHQARAPWTFLSVKENKWQNDQQQIPQAHL